MADEAKRADLGFQGGQILSVRVSQESLDSMREALSDGSSARWHELKTVDADIAIDLAQVVYVRVETEEQRVGF